MGKTSYIKKVSNTIEKFGGVFIKKSETSNSVYYNVYGNKVRVSDHLAPVEPTLNTHDISITSASNDGRISIVAVRNKPIVYTSMRELNNFIRSYCDYSKCSTEAKSQLYDVEIEKKKEKLKKLGEMVEEENGKLMKARGELSSFRLIGVPDAEIYETLTNKQKADICNTIVRYDRQNKGAKNKK